MTWFYQQPSDGHRTLALVGPVGQGSVEAVGGAATEVRGLVVSGEQDDVGSEGFVVDVPLTGLGRDCRRRL